MAASFRSEQEVAKLVDANRNLVEYSVNQYMDRFGQPAWMERSDLVSWGLMGLLQAARAFDSSRGLKFSTLAVMAIGRMVVRGAKRESKPNQVQRTLSLDVPINPDDPDSDWFRDLIVSADDVYDTVEKKAFLDDLLAELSDEDQRTLKRRFLENEPGTTIARDLGVNKQTLFNRHNRALAKLRELSSYYIES